MKRGVASRKRILSVLARSALAGTVICAVFCSQASAEESLPGGMKLVGIEAFPRAVELNRQFEYRQVLLTGQTDGGDSVDVTRMARVSASADVVEVNPDGKVSAVRDGDATLTFTVGEHQATVSVKVNGQNEPYSSSFVQDVMPVLSRLGCNSGTCHGAAKGKNGFKLSLRGHDPLFDHGSLTDDLGGRRFNRAAPKRSLFLMKLTGGIPHVGGVRTETDTPYYKQLQSWVVGGVKLDLESSRVSSIEIFPQDVVLPLPGMRQRMAVLATYTDGRVRDVSAEAFLQASNTEVTEVSADGLVTAARRGETAILARYEGRYAATQLYVMGDRAGFQWKDQPEYNYVDALVYKKLERVKTLPSGECTDAEFIRRIYLDLTGLQPNSRTVRAFLLDTRNSKLKRDEVVDRLIGSAEFIEFWTNKWCDLLQVNPKFLGPQGADALRGWVRQAVASNRPYDEFVASVLSASGSTVNNPPAAYYKVLRTPEDAVENTTQLFLGIRFSCNKCHDHPFERWTQHNYWELAAFFSQVGREDAPGSPKMKAVINQKPYAFEEIISDLEKGEVVPPYGGGAVAPSFPYEHEGATDGASRREQLTRWLATPENPYFAKSFVNRLWSYLLGVGLIDPVDDVRASNPPSNPELLDRLTAEFVESGFDVRKILRRICMSRVYRHSIRTNEWNAEDEINFSHALARRLAAETLYDALHQATGTVTRVPGRRTGTRASELGPDVKLADGFLDLFGRPPRESACECERSSGMSLGQAISLVNGPTVAEAIRNPQSDLNDLARVETNAERVFEEIYLSVLCRMPTDAERQLLRKTFDVTDLANIEALTDDDATVLKERLAGWEKSHTPADWVPLDVQLLRSAAGATLETLDDGSILASGDVVPRKDTYTLVGYTDLRGITGLRLEVLPDESLPKKGPGRGEETGDFVLTELRVSAAGARDPTQTKAVVLQNATSDLTAAAGRDVVSRAIDGKLDDSFGWSLADQVGKRHVALFETKEDVGVEDGTLLTLSLDQQHGQGKTLGRFRISVTKSARPVRYLYLPDDVIAALKIPASERNPEHHRAIFRQYIPGDSDMQQRIRINATQDLAWVLINSPAFLFNH